MNYAVIAKIVDQKVHGTLTRIQVVIVLERNIGDGTVTLTTNCFVNTSIEVNCASNAKNTTKNVW